MTKVIMSWCLVGFLIRLLALFATHIYSVQAGFGGFFPLEAGNDDILYWDLATEALAGTLRADNPNSYAYFLGLLFSLFGQDLILGKFVNVLFSVASIYFSLKIAKLFLDKNIHISDSINRKSLMWLGVVLALYPSSILYSTQLVRDSLMQFLGIICVYFLVRFIRRPSIAPLILVVASLFLLYGLRPYLVFGILAAVIVFVIFIWNMKLVPKIGIVSLLFVFVAIVPNFLGLGFFGINYIQKFANTEFLTAFRQDAYSIGGSSVGLEINYSNPIAFLATFSPSFLTVMFGPFPWQIKSAAQLIALPEALFMLSLFGYWLKGFSNLKKLDSSSILFLGGLFITSLIAIYSDNIGTNTRLRILPWSLFLIFVSLHIKAPLSSLKRFNFPKIVSKI